MMSSQQNLKLKTGHIWSLQTFPGFTTCFGLHRGMKTLYAVMTKCNRTFSLSLTIFGGSVTLKL